MLRTWTFLVSVNLFHSDYGIQTIENVDGGGEPSILLRNQNSSHEKNETEAR